MTTEKLLTFSRHIDSNKLTFNKDLKAYLFGLSTNSYPCFMGTMTKETRGSNKA